MKRLIAMFGCAVLLAAPPAMAQATKTVKGSVTAVGTDSITVKVAGKDMTFGVDSTTHVVTPGGGTKARAAKEEGKKGPVLTDVVKTGQAVSIDYHEQGMHAAAIRTIAAVPPPPAPPAGTSGAAPAKPSSADAAQKPPKAQVASGVVTAVSGNSLTVKAKSGDVTFAVDSKTTVSGKGLGTASKKMAEAGGKPTLTDFVHQGDTVNVTYHDMGGTKNASLVRIIVKKS